jgi:hypothetical protein
MLRTVPGNPSSVLERLFEAALITALADRGPVRADSSSSVVDQIPELIRTGGSSCHDGPCRNRAAPGGRRRPVPCCGLAVGPGLGHGADGVFLGRAVVPRPGRCAVRRSTDEVRGLLVS